MNVLNDSSLLYFRDVWSTDALPAEQPECARPAREEKVIERFSNQESLTSRVVAEGLHLISWPMRKLVSEETPVIDVAGYSLLQGFAIVGAAYALPDQPSFGLTMGAALGAAGLFFTQVYGLVESYEK
jgi:hypothetical protein